MKLKLLLLLLVLGLFPAWHMVSAALAPSPELSLLKSDGLILEKLGLQEWIPLSHISLEAVNAVLVSEDDLFYSHRGFEPRAIRRAALKDLRSLEWKRGGSTITQQVARNLFLGKEKTLRRKLRELVLAHRMEKIADKDRILEIYMNIAQFGPELYGLGQASRYYFDKDQEKLGPKECAFLAMLLPSPVRYGRSFEERRLTPFAKRGVRRILRHMARAEDLDPEWVEQAMSEPLSFESQVPEDIKSGTRRQVPGAS